MLMMWLVCMKWLERKDACGFVVIASAISPYPPLSELRTGVHNNNLINLKCEYFFLKSQ